MLGKRWRLFGSTPCAVMPRLEEAPAAAAGHAALGPPAHPPTQARQAAQRCCPPTHPPTSSEVSCTSWVKPLMHPSTSLPCPPAAPARGRAGACSHKCEQAPWRRASWRHCGPTGGGAGHCAPRPARPPCGRKTRGNDCYSRHRSAKRALILVAATCAQQGRCASSHPRPLCCLQQGGGPAPARPPRQISRATPPAVHAAHACMRADHTVRA